ncbi:hypothetical protein K1719_020807 [Acacia pycnantha]|nr:hypothetical protein K1719_020807 [Acacia pycnantha]
MNRELTLALPLLILLLCSLIVFNLRRPFDRQGFWSHFFANDTLPHCDYSDGRWLWDQSYSFSHSYHENCPFLDLGFRCHLNGHHNETFRQWRLQPHAWHLPRFNARDFLERSRNGRIVFAGDSVGRNQWESLLCMLASGISNISTIYEDTILVPLSLYLHLPLHPLKFKRGCYFQEGANVNMSMDMSEAFRRSIQTWKSWALNSLDPDRSFIFFCSYSPIHYWGGEWNKWGGCDNEIEPDKDTTRIETKPYNNEVIYEVVKQMEYGKWKV